MADLTDSLAISNYAIAQLNERVSGISKAVTKLADYSIDTRQQLQKLSDALHLRLDKNTQDLARIDIRARAHLQMEKVLSKWAAGDFNAFSRAGRCYAALEELRWGEFGDYCRLYNDQPRKDLLEALTYKSIDRMATDAHIGQTERSNIKFWIVNPTGSDWLQDATEALAYLGDWSNPARQPFVYSITQLPEKLPEGLPLICHAKRLAPALVSELFEEQ